MAKAEAQAMTWDHKGTAITLGSHGDFTATDANGKFIRVGSLDGMKKKLDAARESKFQPFKALDLSFYPDNYERGRGIREVNVSGVEKDRGRHAGVYFVGKATTGEQWRRDIRESKLHPNTPECLEAYHTYMKLCVKNEELRKAMKEAEREAFDAIPVIKAESYQP